MVNKNYSTRFRSDYVFQTKYNHLTQFKKTSITSLISNFNT